MTLKDLIAADTANVILNTNDFAESVVIYRRRGGQESATAVVFESVEYRDGQHVIEKVSVLTVTGASSLSFEVGDAVRRSTDATESRWLFDGEADPMQGMTSWRFLRVLPAQYGGNLYGREV